MGDDTDLQKHLKNLIEKSSLRWTYAILWECSSQRRVLRFKDGYHRGSKNPKEIRIMGSCVSVAQHSTDDDAASEWFFKISSGQSFEINEDLPGYALIAPYPEWVYAAVTNSMKLEWGRWERTKWGHQFGIQTFSCIPLKDQKVLELASTEIIPYNINWIHHDLDLILPIGTFSNPLAFYLVTLHQQQQEDQKQQQQEDQKQQRRHQLIEQLQLQLTEQRKQKQKARRQQRLHQLIEQQKQHRQQQQHQQQQRQQPHLRSEETKNRGKEKISDSKCSWTLLTESTDRGTERTFSCSHDYSGPS